MDLPVPTVARAPRQTRDQLIHRLDGRYGALTPDEVLEAARALAGHLDLASTDLILGIPEGGTVPAFAVAQLARLPLVLATRTVVDITPRISFHEPHVPDNPDFHFYGLQRGTRVAIIEDEVTTGRTLVNAVEALRRAGVVVTGVAAFFVVDHPATRRRLADAGLEVVSGMAISAEFIDRVGADGA